MRIIRTAVIALAAMFLPQTGSAALLGIDFSAGTLYDVDTATGAATNARSIGFVNVAGIARDPASGSFYGLTTLGGLNSNSLIRIDPVTGAGTLVGATGLSNIFEGDLAFNPTNGVLYGIQDVPMGTPGPRNLFTLNVTTGAATTVGTVATSGDLSALAFNALGVLYTINTQSDVLHTVNPLTGAVLTSTSLSTALGTGAGLTFDPVSGTAYVVDGIGSGTDSLYTLNTATGSLTLIGALGVSDGLSGLAFNNVAAVPEPSTYALMLAGLGVVGFVAGRRRKALDA